MRQPTMFAAATAFLWSAGSCDRGNSFVVSDALLCTQKILADRRAVIGLEPTNRFTNRATINIGVDALGHWRSEIIGPGFDASDLQRDGTPPEYICGGLPISTTEFSTMQQDRKSTRLNS